MRKLKLRKRIALTVGVILAVMIGGVVGGTGTGNAATSFNITLEPLIGTSGNDIPQVSYGGKIGYHLHINNNGDSTTQKASILVTSDSATFLDVSDTTNCAVNPKDTHQMVCTPFGGTFAPGATFEADLRFTAPTTGTQVSTFASITVSAQTVGGNKNNGTTLAQSLPVLTNIVENTTKADTYLRKGENAATGNLSLPSHPQNFGVIEPPTLFGDPFGIAVSMHDIVGTLVGCSGCFGAYTQVTIPKASLVSQSGNPFYDGTMFNPYKWAMNAQYSSGSNFKLHGVVHNSNQLPTCASLVTPDNPLGNPTVANPACYDTLEQITSKKILTATGRGLENGNWGFN
jgi:hypothetical protein